MILSHSHSIPDNYLDLIVYTPVRKASAMHFDKPGSLSFGRTSLHDLHLRRWRLMMKVVCLGMKWAVTKLSCTSAGQSYPPHYNPV